MDRAWDLGVTLLEILAGITMLVSVVFFLGLIAHRETQLNAYRATAQAQRDYANFQRFHGNGIAYTEVIQAIWELSSPSIPVLVIPYERFLQVTYLNNPYPNATSSGFPLIDPVFNAIPGLPLVPFEPANPFHSRSINPIRLPHVAEHIYDWLFDVVPPTPIDRFLEQGQGVVFREGVLSDSIYLLARGIQGIYPPTPLGRVMQTQVADALRETSIDFNGRVLRDGGGVPFMIVFFF